MKKFASFKYKEGFFDKLEIYPIFLLCGLRVCRDKRPSFADFRASGLGIYSQKYCLIIPLFEIIFWKANLHMRVDEDESASGEVPHLIGQVDEGGEVEGRIGLLHTPIN
jgi:hypothetical protein